MFDLRTFPWLWANLCMQSFVLLERHCHQVCRFYMDCGRPASGHTEIEFVVPTRESLTTVVPFRPRRKKPELVVVELR